MLASSSGTPRQQRYDDNLCEHGELFDSRTGKQLRGDCNGALVKPSWLRGKSLDLNQTQNALHTPAILYAGFEKVCKSLCEVDQKFDEFAAMQDALEGAMEARFAEIAAQFMIAVMIAIGFLRITKPSEMEAMNEVEAVKEEVIKVSDEHGEKVVVVKGGVVAKVTVPSMQFKSCEGRVGGLEGRRRFSVLLVCCDD